MLVYRRVISKYIFYKYYEYVDIYIVIIYYFIDGEWIIFIMSDISLGIVIKFL